MCVCVFKCNDLNESYSQYFPVVLFIMLYQMVLILSLNVGGILKCDHSNKGNICLQIGFYVFNPICCLSFYSVLKFL